MMGLNYAALVVKRVGKTFQLLQLTCKDADKGQPQTEQLIATLKPTAEDKIDYKPGIHEDIYLRLSVSYLGGSNPDGSPQHAERLTDAHLDRAMSVHRRL